MPIFRPHRKRPEGSPPLGSTPRAITRRTLDSALASARSAYPNEFGGVLRADPPGVIGELLLVPGTTAGRRHARAPGRFVSTTRYLMKFWVRTISARPTW